MALGSNALFNNTTAGYNTAIGASALYANTLGENNTATGSLALYSNTEGTKNIATGASSLYNNTTGSYNTAIGFEALNLNIDGINNTASGASSLHNNTHGYDNTATGISALYSNTVGYANTANGAGALGANIVGRGNTATGWLALAWNTDGEYNTADGTQALYYNTTGDLNAANGEYALYYNTEGSKNTASGSHSLENNTIGNFNTATGQSAGSFNDNNLNCSFFGYDANQAVTTDFTNSMALGNASRITDNNQVRIGNAAVTSIGGYQSWTNISDGRYKKGIKENVPGLKFINKLKPVTYHLDVTGIRHFLGEDNTVENNKDGFKEMSAENKARIEKGINEKEKVVYSGLVAQDVEKAAQGIGYDFSGVDKPKDDHGLYGLRYAEFVVPLVKAVQELNDSLLKSNASLQSQIDELKTMVQALANKNSPAAPSNNISISSAKIEQNIPNPFKQNTAINYYLPQNAGNAFIKVTGINGETIKTVTLTATGSGQFTLQTASLSAGTYSYSLYVGGKLIDTKKMLVTK